MDEMLVRTGLAEQGQTGHCNPGFSEGDAAAYLPPPSVKDKVEEQARNFGGGAPGVDVWNVKTDALTLMGFMPGDLILVDSRIADRPKRGDVVVAQVSDWNTGSATTVLRRFEPPVLVAASMNPATYAIHVVDGNNVAIRGIVIASWRA